MDDSEGEGEEPMSREAGRFEGRELFLTWLLAIVQRASNNCCWSGLIGAPGGNEPIDSLDSWAARNLRAHVSLSWQCCNMSVQCK